MFFINLIAKQLDSIQRIVQQILIECVSSLSSLSIFSLSCLLLFISIFTFVLQALSSSHAKEQENLNI